MRRLRWAYGLIAALVAAILAYTVFWFHLAGQVRQGIDDWAAARRAEGWQVAYGLPAVSGYPYRLVVDVTGVTLAQPQHAQAWEVRVDAIKAVTQPWTLSHMILLPAGKIRADWGREAARTGLTFGAADTRASLILGTQGRLLRLAIESSQVSVEGRPPQGAAAVTWAADHLEFHLRDNRGASGQPTAIDLALSADRVTLPKDPGPPFGPVLARGEINLGLAGPVDAPTVAQWRDDGGTLELRQLALNWGPVELTCAGTLALDKQMRPIGALTAEIKGWEAVLDHAAEVHSVTRNQATALRIALGLMSKPGKDGSRVLQAPISAQDGRLYVGPAQVMELPPLALP